MAGRHRKTSPFPDTSEILAYLRDNPDARGRDVARAFRLDPRQRADLKTLLDRLEDEGALPRRRRARRGGGTLPSVTVIEITGTDTDGEVLARPVSWESDATPPPIVMVPEKKPGAALGPGDRVLARLNQGADGTWEARTMRRIPSAPSLVLGLYTVVDGKGRIKPTDRRAKHDFAVDAADTLDAQAGDLVRAQVLPGRRLGLRQARVVERLHDAKGPGSISLIAIHEHDLPGEFDADALAEAAAAGPAGLDGREDLRDLPLITIDGADARDFDDAVWAAADADGGWHLIVAIADVAHYVQPGSRLDAAAYERGNSAYFPDRVVPMLPEELSNGWCSLRPDEDRPCLAADLWLDRDGTLRRHRFRRGLMRSTARLTYEQVQAIHDGDADSETASLRDTVVAPLYGAYAALAQARAARGVLEIDLPERRVVLDDDGTVAAIEKRNRFDSHRLIEEFMIAANVAAAEALEAARQPCMYRIHAPPDPEKLEALRTFLDSIGLKLARGQVVRPADLNRFLAAAAGTDNERLVNEVVLRSQAQAEYAPGNIGHFGLALRRYAHFTSPIRRYSDLVVHRALIRGLGLGSGSLGGDGSDFTEIGKHISMTERRAAVAERDAINRFTAAFLVDRVGAVFPGRINGATRFGLFITLDDTGADGLVPMRSLGDDYYVHDAAHHLLRGRRGGKTWRLGDAVRVRLAEADPDTGGIVFDLIDGGATGSRRPEKPPGKGKSRSKGKSRGKGKARKRGRNRKS